jgi:hypothetical protein
LDRLRGLSSVRDLVVRAQLGSRLGLRRDGSGGAPVRIGLVADSPEELWADLREVAKATEEMFEVREAAP